jgi:glycosyltransferase involved in cell wall biosynthesis
MKALSIVHTENSCGWGGQEIRILTEARGFLDRGHRVTLIAPAEAPIAPAGERMGIPVVRLDIRRKRLAPLLALRRWLADHRAEIDIVNTHSSTDSWLTALACATLAAPPPIVRTRHVSTTIRNRPTTRWLYARATAHIVTAGEALKRQLARDNGIPLEHMTSIPTGIDLDRFVPGNAVAARIRLGLPERPTLGIVATLRDWKGHDDLFEALARDRTSWREWNVIVIGDGPYRSKLERHLAALRLADQVKFVGQQDDVAPWFQALDLFVLPSWGEEGVPQAIMQAMACGIAVVSTTTGAITEAVDDRVTGLIVAPRDVVALGAALATLRADPALRAQFGAAGRTRALRDFGVARMLDDMDSVFRAVLGHKPPPSSLRSPPPRGDAQSLGAARRD